MPARRALAEGEPLVIDENSPRTLVAALKRTARDFPGKGIRFINRDGTETLLRYPELLSEASKVNAGLRRAGLKPGAKVILQVDCLSAHYTAFWGCLLGGIVPVTIAIPPTYTERNGVVNKLVNTWELLENPAIITSERLRESIAGLGASIPLKGLSVLCIEELLNTTDAPIEHEPMPSDVAFIQLSSGSTGVPKCIQETHQGVIAHVFSSKAFNNYTSDDVSLNWLPVDHVVPLLTFHLKDTCLGCEQIHVPTDLVLAEPLLWLDLIHAHRVTHTWSPNFGFKLVSDRLGRIAGKRWNLTSVKFFMNAGEQVTMPVVRDFLSAVAPFGAPENSMQPAFGMAEVCTCMTYANHFSVATGARRYLKSSLDARLQASESAESADAACVEFVSLGKVTPGISMRIADASNQVLPEGVIGRLQIKGPVVTPGYFRNDEANHDAFVGGGWFNTGDLGFIEDGELFLTGREKEMIIIRGAKFYCYEVEDVVNAIPGVEPTFVAACGVGDPRTGTESLAIFFSSAGITDDFNLAQAIRKRVTGRLGITPGHVVPIPRAQFPKTTSGKIQRTLLKKNLETGVYDSVLKEIDAGGSRSDSNRPLTAIEERLSLIWRDVLGVSSLRADSHLFDVGGDSLKATQIASRVREQWKLELPLRVLFDGAGTIEGMAHWIANNENRRELEPAPHIQRTSRNRKIPLSHSQLRIWLAEQIDPGTSLYNICRTVSLKGAVNAVALEHTFIELVRRHEILRTTYHLEDMPVQEVHADAEFALPRHDLAHLPAADRDRICSNLVSFEVSRPFDLTSGPLLRAKLIRLAENEHLLVLVFHQIVIDAWSLKVFFNELAALYDAFASARKNPLPPLPIQYIDYAVWQNRWFSDAALEPDMAYWSRRLAPPLPVLHFPKTERTIQGAAAEVQSLSLPKPLVQKLRAFSTSEGSTLYMTLLAVYKVLLLYWTNEPDMVVGSPESGRRRLETEKLLGYFVNMLVLRTQLSRRESFRTALGVVRETTLEAVAHANVPFEKLFQSIQPGAGGYGRLFSVWFGPIDSLTRFRMGDLDATPRPVFPPAAQFDLSCFVADGPDGVTCFFEHDTAALSPSQLTRFIRQFEWLLTRVVESPETSVGEFLAQLQTLDERGLNGRTRERESSASGPRAGAK